MNIDFSQPILDPTGKPMPKDKDNPEATTLGFAAANALFAVLPGDEKMEPAKKAKMGNLGLRLFDGGEQDVSPEEVVQIRDRTARIFPSLIVARVFALTDGAGG